MRKKITRGDSIRAMTDEELAVAFWWECNERESCYGCRAYKENGKCPGPSISAWEEWLKQPEDEEELCM